MFGKTKKAFDAGYQRGFNDALEMVKQLIRQKSAEDPVDRCLQWEDMRNGEVYPETETD